MTEQQTQQPTFDQLKYNQDENIKRTANEIAEITNGKDDTEKKVQLEGILTTEFANTLDPQTANTLLTEAQKAQSDNTDQGLKDLIAFLESIAKPHNTKGELDDIDEGNNKTTRDYYDTYFGESGLLSMIPENYNNEQILKIKEELTSINSILDNITQDNVKKLQKFLWENVTNGQLRSLNGENAPQTGNFAEKTQADLKTFLDNTKNYIENYNKHLTITEKGDKQQQEIQEATNAVNGLTNPTQESYDEAKQKYDAAKEKYRNSFDLDNKLSQTLNTAGEELQKQQERQKASKSTMTFETLSQKLQTLNNSEINGILAQQIKPLNEKLKQGPSINELKAKIEELEGKINSYDKDGLGLDNKDKKGNRKAINDLQNELKQVKKEFDNKTDIKEDLSTQLSRIKDIIKKISSPDNTENEIILKNIKDFYGLQNDENTGIIKKENEQGQEQGQEQDRTPFSQYERSLDDIGNGKEPSETTQGESSPEQTNQTQTPEQAQKGKSKEGINTKTRTLSELFTKFFEAFAGGGTFIEKMNKFWKDLIGKESTTKSDDLKINLEDLANNSIIENNDDVKMALEAINNETKAFNGRKEIVNAINGKEEQQIKNLQRKLRKFPNGERESPINITGTIDKSTAEALRAYAQKAQNNTNQKNDNAMPYAFCEGYTPIDISKYNTQQDKQYEAYTTNDNKTTILITKDSDGNIMSIKKGKYCEANGQNDWDFPKMNGQMYSLDKENNTIIKNGFNDLQS